MEEACCHAHFIGRELTLNHTANAWACNSYSGHMLTGHTQRGSNNTADSQVWYFISLFCAEHFLNVLCRNSFTPHNSPMSVGNYSHFTDEKTEVHRGLNANTVQVHKYWLKSSYVSQCGDAENQSYTTRHGLPRAAKLEGTHRRHRSIHTVTQMCTQRGHVSHRFIYSTVITEYLPWGQILYWMLGI